MWQITDMRKDKIEMTQENISPQDEIQQIQAKIHEGINHTDDMLRLTRRLIRLHIHLGMYEEAKVLLRKYFNFNRKDLLQSIADICTKTRDASFAEELIGECRCYSYVWMEFCVVMQRLYITLEQNDKADAIHHSIIETALASIRPATKALYKSFNISGNTDESYIIHSLHRELKRIYQEYI